MGSPTMESTANMTPCLRSPGPLSADTLSGDLPDLSSLASFSIDGSTICGRLESAPEGHIGISAAYDGWQPGTSDQPRSPPYPRTPSTSTYVTEIYASGYDICHGPEFNLAQAHHSQVVGFAGEQHISQGGADDQPSQISLDDLLELSHFSPRTSRMPPIQGSWQYTSFLSNSDDWLEDGLSSPDPQGSADFMHRNSDHDPSNVQMPGQYWEAARPLDNSNSVSETMGDLSAQDRESDGNTTEEETSVEGAAGETQPTTSQLVLCQICGKWLKQSSLSKHVSFVHTHSDKKPFACQHPYCNVTFKTNRDLSRHSRSHSSGPKPFSCTLCTYASVRKDNVVRHVKKSHPRIPEERAREHVWWNGV